VTDGIVIRPARRGDAPELADCWIEFGHYYADRDPVRFRVPEASGLSEWFEKRIEDSQDLWLVAERARRVIGFVEAQVWPAEDHPERHLMREAAEPVLKVSSVFVTEQERGHGIGRGLMQAAEAWGQEMGATSVAVVAIADSPSAVPFYTDGMGYQQNSIGFWKAFS
jgi:GNAT superfamily N-acetyltransferase